MSINNTPVDVLQDQKWETVTWKKLQVGDIVKVKQDTFFPADLLFLASTNPDGVCYIETSNLDGETNLKIRKALEKTWDYLLPEKASEFKEQTMSIAKKLCYTISELASILLPGDTWPELLPFIFEAVTADSPRLKKSALLIFSQLAQSIGEIVLPHLPVLHPIFLNSLSNFVSLDVRIAALGASINFVQCLSAADHEPFQDLLPAMMQTLTEAHNSGNEATAQEALKLLVELADTKPQFFMGQLGDVACSMFEIADADGLEEGTRYLALEFVVTLYEARPMMMSHFDAFLLVVLMNIFGDIEDDTDWHAAETEDEDAEVNYMVGREYMDRLFDTF